jgi:APA family basic amino acid/polyamine antiporter
MAEPATRKLGFWMCTALVVGGMIGTGIFLLPASLAPYGWSAAVGWGVSVAGALVLALLFAALGRAFPTACGPYDYARIAFGAPTGFVIAWSYWIASWVGNAALATGAVSYLSAVFPPLGVQPTASVAAIALVWGLTGVSSRGARATGVVQVVTTVLKMLPLLAVVGLGGWLFVSQDPVLSATNAPATFSIYSVSAAAALTLWALIGVESATIPGGKVADPERTVPRATLLGTAICAVLYVLVSLTVMMLIPAATLAQSNAPFAEVARMFWGNGGALAIAAFAAISAIGTLNGWVLLVAEIPFQLARQGVFPSLFARESARGAPLVSLFISGGLTSVLIVLNSSGSLIDVFSFIILLSTSIILFFYLSSALAILKLRYRREWPAASGHSRWLPYVAVIGVVYSLWAIYGAGLIIDAKACGGELVCWAPMLSNPTVLGLALLATGVPVYYLMQRGKVVAAATA